MFLLIIIVSLADHYSTTSFSGSNFEIALSYQIDRKTAADYSVINSRNPCSFKRNFGQSVLNMNNTSILLDDNSTEREETELHSHYSCPMLGKTNLFGKVAKIAAIAVIIAISLTGNILVIILTRRTHRTWKAAYNLVVNMAIADLFNTIVNMPEFLVEEIRDTDEWIAGVVGVILCKVLPFCQQICAFCSILSLLAIAFDRFIAICLPLKRIITRKCCKIIISVSWLIPCISSAPMFFANNVIKTDGFILCLEEWPAPFNSMKAVRDYTTILFVLFYFLPLVIISTLYSCIICKIWRRKHPGNICTKNDRVHSRSKRKSLQMFIAIVACFALCWLPYHVTFFLTSYDEYFYNCGLPEHVDFIEQFLTHATSAFNPCIYMVFNKEYRAGVKRMVTTSCKL